MNKILYYKLIGFIVFITGFLGLLLELILMGVIGEINISASTVVFGVALFTGFILVIYGYKQTKESLQNCEPYSINYDEKEEDEGYNEENESA